MKCAAVFLLVLAAAPGALAGSLGAVGDASACNSAEDRNHRALIQQKLASLGVECEEMCKRLGTYPQCQCPGFAGQPASDGDTRACTARFCQDPSTPCPTDAFVNCVKETTKVSVLQWDALLQRVGTDLKLFGRSMAAISSRARAGNGNSTRSASALVEKKAQLDINQKVYVENAPVLGDGAGEGALGQCQAFAPQHVKNPAAPNVKVCGTGIKATVFMRGRCESYYTHQVTIGKCDTGLPASTCEALSPAQQKTLSAYQSYLIEQC